MTKVGGHGCGGDTGGHADNMANANAFDQAMQQGDTGGGAQTGQMGASNAGNMNMFGSTAQSMVQATGGQMSMTFNMSMSVQRQSQQVNQQAQTTQQHLCGCSHSNQQFDVAQQQMSMVMIQLGQVIQQLMQSINGNADTNGGGGVMNQMQGIMGLMKALMNLMQAMQQNAFGGQQGNGGANQGAQANQGGITAAINQLTQLLEMIQQIDDAMGQVQEGGQGAGQGAGNGAAQGGGQNAGQNAGQAGGASMMLGMNAKMNGEMTSVNMGGNQQNLNDLPEMAQGKWAADHGGYQKTEGGYEVTQGALAGHTMKWNAEINAFLVYNQQGELCGKHTSQGGEDKVASPIAFDMNGDGKIGTTGQTTAKDGERSELGRTVDFDIDGDGSANQIEWMAGDGDALLVDNRDGNAAGDMSGKRLFGDQGGKYSDGYQKLSQLDTNGDNQLTGAELEGLSLWQDNGDAKVQAGEMVSAAEAGVTQISTERKDIKNEAGETLMRSQAEVAGKEMMTEDVWFGEDH